MRRKVDVGYPRGEETRARILNVALKLFGTKGFDSVSTREIAVAASVPAPSLRYYFQNKDGLYVACFMHLQSLAFKQMEPVLIEMEALLKEKVADVDRLIDIYCDLQEVMIDSLIGGPDAAAVALFVIRNDLPEGIARKLSGDATAALRMMYCFTESIMRISGNSLDRQAALVVSGLVNGQMTAIHVSRNRLAEIGWDITPERLRWLKRTIRKHSTAMLRSYSGDVRPKTVSKKSAGAKRVRSVPAKSGSKRVRRNK